MPLLLNHPPVQDIFQPRHSIRAAASELRGVGLDRLLHRKQPSASSSSPSHEELQIALSKLNRDHWLAVRDEANQLRSKRDHSHVSWKPFILGLSACDDGKKGVMRENDFQAMSGESFCGAVVARLSKAFADKILLGEGGLANATCVCPFWLSAREASLWEPWLQLRSGETGVCVHLSASSSDDCNVLAKSPAENQQEVQPAGATTFVVNAEMIPPDDLRDFCAFSKMPRLQSRSPQHHNKNQTRSGFNSFHRLYSGGKWSNIQSKNMSMMLDREAELRGYPASTVWFNVVDVLEARLPMICDELKLVGSLDQLEQLRCQLLPLQDSLSPRSISTNLCRPVAADQLAKTIAGADMDGNVFPLTILGTTHFFNLSQLIFF